MKLSNFISLRGISLDAAADEIGDVSVSGLRKWLAETRMPRPDQMRRVHEWSAGAVTPNDWVLPASDHVTAPSSDEGENAARAAECLVPSAGPAAQEVMP